MEPEGGIGPERPASLPTGPHPTIGPGTVRMPRWPGPLLGVGGAILFIGALTALALVGEGALSVENPAALGVLAMAGGILAVAGLVYASVRQLRVRRFLAPDRYRGPSVFLLLALVLVVTNLLAVPFLDEMAGLITGEDLSLIGSAVLLVSTQVSLLLVTWLFILRPRALADVRFPGIDTPRAVRMGLAWGIIAWVVGAAVSFVVVAVLDALGIEPTPQTAEQALRIIDPLVAVPAIVVVAPIAEELFFRGVVFNAWLREGGRRAAYLGSSALFGAIHLNLAVFLPILVISLIFAWIYERTRNLWAPILAHAVFNAVNVAIFYLEEYGIIRLPF